MLLLAENVTNQCKISFRNFQDKNLIVIDTPEFLNNEEDIGRSIQITVSGDSSYALVLVIDLYRAFSHDEEKVIDLITEMYDSKIFKCFILVFTGLDKFNTEDVDIEEHIEKQKENVIMKALTEQCGHRYLVANYNAGSDEKDLFVKNLVDIMSKMLALTNIVMANKYSDTMIKKKYFQNYKRNS
ncbi:unnamed protein product [Didymodactylos carnosus]|uniref:AIG1-type G domain-containing protein n=1 Tax=Didymodactylos carnosus TaxID=1234261 RepID=A0A814R865_9BILA|nr:unnamed protein product [Didymodactylos carnosus]CAF1356981.1 unnamed protein product [Didymodactylos carnosus]CAF3894027.1 unnamed protein product [Didymodactylos carnosus]CAF4167188.1 unnamed protein product [Didymodactylos carnosus]